MHFFKWNFSQTWIPPFTLMVCSSLILQAEVVPFTTTFFKAQVNFTICKFHASSMFFDKKPVCTGVLVQYCFPDRSSLIYKQSKNCRKFSSILFFYLFCDPAVCRGKAPICHSHWLSSLMPSRPINGGICLFRGCFSGVPGMPEAAIVITEKLRNHLFFRRSGNPIWKYKTWLQVTDGPLALVRTFLEHREIMTLPPMKQHPLSNLSLSCRTTTRSAAWDWGLWLKRHFPRNMPNFCRFHAEKPAMCYFSVI